MRPWGGGGYYALRGALDKRIKAYISVDGFYFMESFARGRMPAWLWRLFSSGFISDGLFDTIIGAISGWTFQTRWAFNHMRWAMGRSSDAQVIRTMLADDGHRELLHSVHCPVLVTGAGSSFYFDPETTRRVLKKLEHVPKGDREEWVATDVAFGGLQAKIGAFGYSMQRTFAYLDGKFGVQRAQLN